MVGKPPLETAGDAVRLIKAGVRLERRQTPSLLDRTKLQHCLYEDEKLNDFPWRRPSCCLCCSATSPPFQCRRQLIFYSLWHLRQRWIFSSLHVPDVSSSEKKDGNLGQPLWASKETQIKPSSWIWDMPASLQRTTGYYRFKATGQFVETPHGLECEKPQKYCGKQVCFSSRRLTKRCSLRDLLWWHHAKQQTQQQMETAKISCTLNQFTSHYRNVKNCCCERRAGSYQ